MSRAVDGTYSAPTSSVSPAVSGTQIDPDDFNDLITDVETAVSDTVYTTTGLGSTDNVLLRTDGTNGKKAQASALSVDDSGNMAGIGYMDFGEVSVPSAPASNIARLYSYDDSGATVLAYKTAAGTIQILSPSATTLPAVMPGGRLSLVTATPVMTSTGSGGTTIYYTPHVHRYVPLYDGSTFVVTDIGGELSQATTDATKSPAACTTNSNYDLFVWSDSGTYRCTRGPAWSSSTSRGTGAGTTELERVRGVYVNKVAITNGPAAQRGTYVGTVRTNGSSQVDWILGATAAGGTAAFFGVYNAYNRHMFTTNVVDNNNSWSYSPATFRKMNDSSGNRISYIDGLGTINVTARIDILVQNASDATGFVGIGVDSETTLSGGTVHFGTASVVGPINGTYVGTPGLGFHYLQALERAGAGNPVSFFGDNGGVDPMCFQATLVM